MITNCNICYRLLLLPDLFTEMIPPKRVPASIMARSIKRLTLNTLLLLFSMLTISTMTRMTLPLISDAAALFALVLSADAIPAIRLPAKRHVRLISSSLPSGSMARLINIEHIIISRNVIAIPNRPNMIEPFICGAPSLGIAFLVIKNLPK